MLMKKKKKKTSKVIPDEHPKSDVSSDRQQVLSPVLGLCDRGWAPRGRPSTSPRDSTTQTAHKQERALPGSLGADGC